MPNYWKKVKQTLSEKFNVKQGQKQVEELKKDGKQTIHRIRKSRKYAKLEDDHDHHHQHHHHHEQHDHHQHHQHHRDQHHQRREDKQDDEQREQRERQPRASQQQQQQDKETHWKDLNSKSCNVESVHSGGGVHVVGVVDQAVDDGVVVVVDKKKKKNKMKKIGKRTRRIARWTWKCLKAGFTQMGPIASGGMSGVGVFVVPIPTSVKKTT